MEDTVPRHPAPTAESAVPDATVAPRATVVLVTGGTGTLGRHVVRLARAGGHEVRVLSRSGAPGTLAGDLRTGEGVATAVRGVETVVHCASSPTRPKDVDVAGTERLLEVAAKAGVQHIVFPSIVGIDRNQGFPLYRAKLAAERLVRASSVPWTIQRATQFHELIRLFLGGLDRVPLLLLVPRGFRTQPVASAEVAARIVGLVGAPAAGRAPELGGPQVRSFASLAQTYLDHVGHDKRIVEVPVPGSAARAFRAGAQVSQGGDLGRVTWEQFLADRPT